MSLSWLLQLQDQEELMLYVQDPKLAECQTELEFGPKCLPEQPARLSHELLHKTILWSELIWSLGCFILPSFSPCMYASYCFSL